MQLSLDPLPGGWSGRTFASEVDGQRVVVRLYPPGDGLVEAPEIDAAVLGLVRGLVPVPQVLEVRRGEPEADVPGLLMTSWMPGTPGDVALAAFDEPARARMGHQMGAMAATLAGMPTLRDGLFVDAALTMSPLGFDLSEWVTHHEEQFTHWSARDRVELIEVAEAADALLMTVGRTCLVHSDLNPKNVLVADDGSVLALVDWEFAHSGHPMTDLGNVLRFERDRPYADAALAGYCELRGGDPDEVLELARCADLWALVALAARRGHNPVTTRAERLLREIARLGDVHAWPDDDL